jgi:uncharacterized protein YbbC (DUF1343 family)
LIGAPWIEPEPLAADLREHGLTGLAFRPTYFKPAFDRFAGEVCGGVQVHLTDAGRHLGAPGIVQGGLQLIAAVYRRYPDHFAWLSQHFDRLIGSDRPRITIAESGGDPSALAPLFAEWQADVASFHRLRADCLRY